MNKDMTLVFVIVSGLLFLIGFILSLFSGKEFFITIGLTTCCTVLIILITLGISLHDVPTAIEVYQGKTTLKITYEDGVPVDSVVIYKKIR